MRNPNLLVQVVDIQKAFRPSILPLTYRSVTRSEETLAVLKRPSRVPVDLHPYGPEWGSCSGCGGDRLKTNLDGKGLCEGCSGFKSSRRP